MSRGAARREWRDDLRYKIRASRYAAFTYERGRRTMAKQRNKQKQQQQQDQGGLTGAVKQVTKSVKNAFTGGNDNQQ